MATFDNRLPMEIMQRLKRQQRQVIIKKMRDAMPVYTLSQIEKIKMKFADVIQLEAAEAGFANTANYIKELISYQENILNTYGRDSLMWYKNRLKESKKELIFLKKALIKAETYRLKGDLKRECKEWIALSSHYGFMPDFENWDWLADQLFLQTVTLCTALVDTNRKYEALSKYLYAHFLISAVKMNDYHFWEIESLLVCAKNLSAKQSWTTQKYLPTKQSANIYNECNYLLYKICIETAKKIYKRDPIRASNLSFQAKNYAVAACHREGKIEALIIQGLTNFINHNAKTAISCLYQGINLKLHSEDVEDKLIWQNTYEILDAFRSGNTYKGIKILCEFKILTYNQSVDLPYYVRCIFKYLGFFCLIKREPFSASRFLSLALYKIDMEKDYEDAGEILAYMAMASGLELFSEYTKVLQNVRLDSEELEKLLQWKDSRINFWPKEIKFSFSEIWNDIVLQKETHRLEHKLLFTVINQEELDMFERTIGPLLEHHRLTAISIKRFSSRTNLIVPLYKSVENEFDNENVDISHLKMTS